MNDRYNKSGNRLPVSVGVGVAVSVAVTLLAALGITAMMISGTIEEPSVIFLGHAAQLLSVFVGIMTAVRASDEKRKLACCLTAVAYGFILTSINILGYDSDFTHAPVTAIMLVVGCLGAMVIKNRNKRVRRPRNKRSR